MRQQGPFVAILFVNSYLLMLYNISYHWLFVVVVRLNKLPMCIYDALSSSQ